MNRQVPNNPTFRLVRTIYMIILVLNAIGIFLYLIGAIASGATLKLYPNLKPEDKKLLTFAVIILSISFVHGLIKQVFSWIGVVRYNTCCLMTVIVLDVLAIILNFVSFFAGNPAYGVFGFIGYILDVSALSYMYIQIRQYDMS